MNARFNKIKVSIIVPVYNVENYIRQCLDSLVEQTLIDIEIILVDDGSIDKSGQICDEYALKDERIIVFHKKNGGLSDARNRGLRAAKGEYILFVDSDDYISLQACEFLYKNALNFEADIVYGCAYQVINGGVAAETIPCHKVKVKYEGKDFLTSNVKNGSMAMAAPYSFYKRSLIIENGLFFEVGLLHEDEYWTPQVYLTAKIVVGVDFYFYYHVTRIGSITQSVWTEKRVNDVTYIVQKLKSIYEKIDNEGKKYLLDYLCMLYLNAICAGKKMDGDIQLMKELACTKKNKGKICLYEMSPRLYFMINGLYHMCIDKIDFSTLIGKV